MSEQLVDLTKIRPKDAAPWTFDQRDLILLLTTGGVGYLVKEALKHCFSGTPSVTEQLEVLANLVETCGRAGAKSLRVRVSTDARFAWQMPKCVKEAKLVGEKPTTIDLEIIFHASRRRPTRSKAAEFS
jgi:hypothetical protein